jgi:hypothetical protein
VGEPTAEERGHPLELVATTAMRTTIPDKREEKGRRGKVMAALLVKVKVR